MQTYLLDFFIRRKRTSLRKLLLVSALLGCMSRIEDFFELYVASFNVMSQDATENLNGRIIMSYHYLVCIENIFSCKIVITVKY